MSQKVGFIGLGIMGRGMVRNLLKAGIDVHVWNRTHERARELAKEGAVFCEYPLEITKTCDIILLCVSDTVAVRDVIAGEHGLIHEIRRGTLVVDHSTISPAATRELAKMLSAEGAHLIDAPVSGGSEGAEKGTLSIMIGGDEDQVARAMPAFEAMGKTITHIGPVGTGQMAKLVNQILVVGNTLAMSEALLFAQAGGLDLEKTLEAVKGGAGGSWMLSNRGPQILDRDWRPGFTIDLQQKDVRLAIQAADELGVPAFATSTVFNLYRILQKEGLGGEGNHALIKALEKMTGLQVGEEKK